MNINTKLGEIPIVEENGEYKIILDSTNVVSQKLLSFKSKDWALLVGKAKDNNIDPDTIMAATNKEGSSAELIAKSLNSLKILVDIIAEITEKK